MEKSSENKIYRAIGLMSGTAMDGIDAALIETDGMDYIKPIGFVTAPHVEKLRANLKSCLNKTSCDRQIERDFTLAQIPVIQKLLDDNKLLATDIDIIGFHGQTIHHDPDNGVTIQIGDGQLLADEMGIDVVYDFRSHDIKNGGQGAPLLPIYHQTLVKNSNLAFPIAILNLGGVGNITYIDTDNIIAFDTGPANALIDDWILTHTGKNYDKNGDTASQGNIDQPIIDTFLSLDYFNKPYPKSLDRNDFKSISVDELSLEDGTATLTDMTVQSVALSVQQCPARPSHIYVTGGGRHNRFIMDQIQSSTTIPTSSVDTLNWDGDAMESEGFAYMAVRSLLGHAISFPTTTGCKHPTTGGVHVSTKGHAA